MRWENPIYVLSNPAASAPSRVAFRHNPVAKDYEPSVPPPFAVVAETEHVRMSGGGWFQHWSVLTEDRTKLKGGIMVKHRPGGGYQTTTYRDGVHVRGVHLGWLLSVQ